MIVRGCFWYNFYGHSWQRQAKRLQLFEKAIFSVDTDRNITLVADGWTLIGYSADDAFDISTATFTNSSGDTVTWANAIAQKKVYGYLAYYDSSPALARNRKYKYAATSGVDDTHLRADKGYWLNARQAGTLTIPSIGGTLNTSTYAWSKLRFHNGTDELNITEVQAMGLDAWVNPTLKYYDNGFNNINALPITRDTISSWEGIFVYSYQDNITLIRQN